MAKFYKALVALPSKSLGAISAAIGFPAALWPTWFEQQVGSRVTADTIQTFGLCLMAASIIYFALLWWLKPDGEVSPQSGQSSSGSGSPNFQSVNGDVNFYNAPPPPAPTQERKSPYGAPSPSPYSGRAMKGLERALLGGGTPKPDLPLAGLLVRVYAQHNVPKNKHEKEDFYRKIDLEIADKVSQNDLSVWGRSGDRPLKPIGRLWDDGEFKHLSKLFLAHESYGPRSRYSDLHFNKAEVDGIWPDPIRTENNGQR